MTIENTQLDSGLRIFSDSIDTVETVTIGLWFNAGARHEKLHNNGIAHFLEHMAFKGTATRNARQIAEEIESVGGFMNAWTGREQTAYYVRLPSESVEVGMDILSDILVNPSFDQGEMERERGVILQEIGRNHDTPDDMVFDLFQETAFPNQSLGHPILGTVDSVTQMNRNHLTDYLSHHYSAPHAVLASSGNLDLDSLFRLGKEKLSSLALNGTPSPFAPGHYRGGACYQTRKEIEQTHIVLGFPAPHYHHPDFYTMKVLSSLMGQGMSSRLFQEIREKHGLAYSVFSFTLSMSDQGLFGIYAGTGPDKVQKLMEGIFHCLENTAKSITETELNRAKTLLRSSLLMSRESPASRAQQMAHHVLTFGKIISLEEQISKISAITPKKIYRLMEKLLSEKATLAAIGPDDAKSESPIDCATPYFSFPETK